MMTDTDYSLIMLKLTQFEDKLKKLEQEIESLKPKKPNFNSTGCLACGKYDCKGRQGYLPCPNMTPYALSSGSLTDGGIAQVWYNTESYKLAKEGEDFEE